MLHAKKQQQKNSLTGFFLARNDEEVVPSWSYAHIAPIIFDQILFSINFMDSILMVPLNFINQNHRIIRFY